MADNRDIFSVMEKMTGLSKDKQKEILEEVQRNHRTLAACPLHDFSESYIPPGRSKLNPEYRCSNCGGHVSSIQKQYYELGFQHAMNLMKEGEDNG